MVEHRDPRKRNITDEDMKALIPALLEALREERHSDHNCRFVGITPEDMAEAVKFFKNFNAAIGNSKHVAWNTIVTLGVGGFIVFLGWAAIMKLKALMGIQ